MLSGHLKMINVFLSASIPLPTRHPRYYQSVDVLLLREAVKALVEIVLPVGRITFGGHPAITPLIKSYVQHAKLGPQNVTIYQSAFFSNSFPEENRGFLDVRIVDAIEEDRELSLAIMRREMIGSQDFDAAVFVGGMEGIAVEAKIFAGMHPGSPLLPIASTGAGAAEVYDLGDYPPELREDLTYISLFRRLLVKN